jgi:hypothetical protein
MGIRHLVLYETSGGNTICRCVAIYEGTTNVCFPVLYI